MPSSDFELLDAWRGGDRGSGDQLFQRHFDCLFRFFQSKVGGEAEDLIQQTLLACVEDRERFRQATSFRAYLLGVARNKLYMFFRARKPGADLSVSSVEDLGMSPRGVAAERQEHRLLLAALRRLPLELQLAVELHYWEELSGPELAEILELPEGTVRSRLRRAREALTEQLELLAASPELLTSTITDLDGWARTLKQQLERGAAG